EIMDNMIIANRNGHIACTQGGESLAGLRKAVEAGYVRSGDMAVLDSTAHVLKFAVFQDMYFQNTFGPEFHVTPREELRNAPVAVQPEGLEKYPEPGRPLSGKDMEEFVRRTTREIARILDLEGEPDR
ncbi:MAG: threonine synthase, partial [Deltaproteobacteria bacterium]